LQWQTFAEEQLRHWTGSCLKKKKKKKRVILVRKGKPNGQEASLQEDEISLERQHLAAKDDKRQVAGPEG